MEPEKYALKLKILSEVDFELNYSNKIIGKQRNKTAFEILDLKDIEKSLETFVFIRRYTENKENGLS